MTIESKSYSRIEFVDFMYAIVVGAVFPVIAPIEMSFRFFGMLFILLIVLEDFYLYHSQVAVHEKHDKKLTFGALVFEISILLAWYLAAIAFPNQPRPFLFAISGFFILKWLSGLCYWGALKMLGDWRFLRNTTFLIPTVVCLYFALWKTPNLEEMHTWILVAFAWIIQTIIWWIITRIKSPTKELSVP